MSNVMFLIPESHQTALNGNEFRCAGPLHAGQQSQKEPKINTQRMSMWQVINYSESHINTQIYNPLYLCEDKQGQYNMNSSLQRLNENSLIKELEQNHRTLQ